MDPIRRLTTFLAASGVCILPLLCVADDWPQWRGPGRNAVSGETHLRTTWPEDGPPLLWKCEGIGEGYSSVVIQHGLAFTTGKSDGVVSCTAIVCSTGQAKWSVTVGETARNVMSTPTVHREHVYVLDPDGELICLKVTDGSVVWRRSFAEDFGGQLMSGRGYGESPLVDGDRLICTPGGPEAMIVALDRFTGDVIWKAQIPDIGNEGRDGAAFSSIGIMDAGGVRQYVQLVGRGLVGVAAEDGRFLWGYNDIANGTANIPTPIIRGNLVFSANGYHAGSVLLKVESDNSASSQTGVKAAEVYRLRGNRFQNHHGGFVLIDGHIFGGHGSNNGLPTCLNFETGALRWKQRGPGTGSASVVAADGFLYFHYQDGVVALIRADAEDYRLHGKFQLPGTGGDSWAHPVIADGRLYLREKNQLYAYSLRADSIQTTGPETAVVRAEFGRLRELGTGMRLMPISTSAEPAQSPVEQQLPVVILTSRHLTTSGAIADAVADRLSGLTTSFGISAEGTKISERGLQQISGLPRLLSLGLELCPNLGDDALGKLSNSTQLRILNLAGTAVTEEGLRQLASLRHLQSIDLEVCDGISDEACVVLSAMKQLRTVNLKKTGFEKHRVGERGLKALAALPNLQNLNLYGNSITDSSLEPLAGHRHLQRLNLSLTRVTDEGLRHLTSLKQLRELTLLYSEGFAGPKITDRGVQLISTLSDLESLNLVGARITDASTEGLVQLAKLKQLSIAGTGLTASSVSNLQRALPDCQIR